MDKTRTETQTGPWEAVMTPMREELGLEPLEPGDGLRRRVEELEQEVETLREALRASTDLLWKYCAVSIQMTGSNSNGNGGE